MLDLISPWYAIANWYWPRASTERFISTIIWIFEMDHIFHKVRILYCYLKNFFSLIFLYFEILLTSDWANWSGHRHWVDLEIGGLPFMSVSEDGEIFKDSIGTQFSLYQGFGKIWRGQIRKPCLASDDILAMKWPLSWVSFTSSDLFRGILSAVFVLCTWRRSVAKTDIY